MKTLIIAEAGINHNGDVLLAKRLIDVAADAEADLIKFQTFSAKNIVTHSVSKADYQYEFTDKDESQYAMLEKLELTEEMHRELIRYSQQRGIGFFSTSFDIDSADMLIRLGQVRFKVPSGEITNLPLLRHIGKQNKEVILSTGMSDLDEVGNAIKSLEDAGTTRSKITALHCTTAYPAPMNDVNLSAMISIQEAFGVSVGYSDHSEGIEVAIAAVALGAKVIEKHFTLDKTLPGPDHKASLEPDELKKMITAIRNIELALGDGVKKIMPSELKNRQVARQSIVAKANIKKGEALSETNITTKRAGSGISPMRWDQIIGSKSKRDYLIDEIID
ncbi:MAG: N-acetylneuraminate synthase [Chitinophagaceae bacterium]|nr:MAG: N-acetylneuraminate synthase [Chitinophagaceae bacterium]